MQEQSHTLDDDAQALIRRLDQQRAAAHRLPLLLAGERSWGVALAQRLVSALGQPDWLWVGAGAPQDMPHIDAARAVQQLGGETGTVIFNGHSGFHAEALAAIAGTIRGGGVLILLMPALAKWPAVDDPDARRLAVALHDGEPLSRRFFRRLLRALDADVVVIESGKPLPEWPISHSAEPMDSAASPCRTEDQRVAVEAIIKVAKGHRRRPLVLMSDRGRGKSAALGIAAAQLLQAGARHILVTAPRPAATASVFDQAVRLLPHAVVRKSSLTVDDKTLHFIAPDELLRSRPAADLLLVDEAAAIPSPLLSDMLQAYARCVFATTVHGYEGTGRGFAVRFQQELTRRTPDWRLLRLATPIRWAAGDPLEQWLFRALLLNAAPAADEEVAGIAASDCTIEHLDRDRLVDDESTLTQLFGLLVLAHYRTRPNDLRYLLDGPNVSVYVMRHEQRVLATALLSREGGFDAEQAQAIWRGERRPHGHLLPESLAVHLGLAQAPRLRGARILRIAVHPALQQRGFGRRLANALLEDSAAQGLNYLGCDFGATPELLRFWRRRGLQPVRVGSKRGRSSGAHTVLMLRALSPAGEAIYHAARQRFADALPLQLTDSLRDLEAELAALLLPADNPAEAALTEGEWRELHGFAAGQRLYEASLPALDKLALAAFQNDAAAMLHPRQRAVLILKLFQKQDWSATAGRLNCAGRGGVLQLLRDAVAGLLNVSEKKVNTTAEHDRNKPGD